VSGKRRRFIDEEFNIDLTYICQDRIIVMSFPGGDMSEKFYRNDAEQVKKFLDMKHPNKYFIFNLSDKEYPKSRFDERVEDKFRW
jgi:phosphatidylinositol-3,4,5-trisphosphate 3-phosphatase/dual-specificity protein phosphatase PTEN